MARPSTLGALLTLAMLGVAGCDGCSDKRGGAGAETGADAAPEAREQDASGDGGGVVNTTVVPTASVAAMLNPKNKPVYDGPTGSIEGTITVTGDPPIPTPADFSRCRAAEQIWGKSFRESRLTDAGALSGSRALADAIVAVTDYEGFIPAKTESQEVTISGCGYGARTVTMTFGQRLDVKNMSKEFWAPVLEPTPTTVLRMATPHGDPVPLYPKKPGHFLLVDHDRRYAVVDVYAFLHPLHTATDLEGHYRIDGIPVGHATLSTTHPRFVGETSVPIDVKPGLVQRVDLTLHHEAKDAGPYVPPQDAGAHPTLH